MRVRHRMGLAAFACATLLLSHPTIAQFWQQGPKLVGAGAAGSFGADQGHAVALSADGNTAVVGGPGDNGGAGAAWIWTRRGGVWTQQGPKLVGSDAAGAAGQGCSVALSADGNTAIVGASLDNRFAGAVWIWTRRGGVWTQQGPKRIGSGAVGNARQGASVSLSADGSTAIVGGDFDNGNAGAAWVWTRSGSVWTQQGPKRVGSDAVGNARQGASVSLSADGNTAIVGGNRDNGLAGAAWVWTRSGSAWTQQGPKLVGSGAMGPAEGGNSVSLSADGNTAIVGGRGDNSFAGAAWVWIRGGGIWTQQGPKLVGSGAAGHASQGFSVSLAGDGHTAIVGGRSDASNAGAAWVWTRRGSVWTQQGSKLVGWDSWAALQGCSVSLSADGHTAIVGGAGDVNRAGAVWVFPLTVQRGLLADFDRDHKADLAIWRPSTGIWSWLTSQSGYDNAARGQVQWPNATVTDVALTGDLDGDGKADLVVWRASTGTWYWLTSSTGYSLASLGQTAQSDNGALGDVPMLADLDGDGKADLVVWRARTGTWHWLTSSTGYSEASAGSKPWGDQRLGDVPMLANMDGDGKADLVVWRARTATWHWLTSSTGYSDASEGQTPWGNANLGDVPMLADLDGDHKADLVLWRASTATWYWLTSSTGYGYASAGNKKWGDQSLGDVPMLADLDGDAKADPVVWRASTDTWLWLTSSTGYTAQGHKQWVNPGPGDIR